MIDCSRSRSIACAQRPARRRADPPGRRTRRASAAASARRAASTRGASAGSGCVVVRFIEQGHRPSRCFAASYRISAAVTATLSDSTGGRIGIVTRSSAAVTSVVRQARAFAAEQNRDRAAQVGTPAAACRAAARSRRSAMPRCSERLDRRRSGWRDCDRQPERAAHRAAQRLPAERIRRAVGRDHAGGAAAVGGADDRADVARRPECRRAAGRAAARAASDLVERRRLAAVRQRDDARGLADRAHRRHHRRGHADDLRAGAQRRDRRGRRRGASTSALGKRDVSSVTPAASASSTRCSPSSRITPSRSAPARDVAEARDEADSGGWRCGASAMSEPIIEASPTRPCYHLRRDESAAAQEVRGRDPASSTAS